MKHIAIFSYHTCPLAFQENNEVGGMNTYVLESSKKLVEKGLKIDIFTRRHDTFSPWKVNITDRLRLFHIPTEGTQTLNKYKLTQFIPEFGDKVWQIMQEEGLHYDLLHAHYYMSGMAALYLRNKFNYKLPIVQNFHTLSLAKNLALKSAQEPSERIEEEKKLINSVNWIISESQLMKNDMIRLYSAKEKNISVIYPGVDSALFFSTDKKKAKEKAGFSLDKKAVLFIGRPDRIKGAEYLIRAVEKIIQKNNSLELEVFLIGGQTGENMDTWSSELKRLYKISKELKIESIVRFLGEKPYSALPIFYNAADCFVLPSLLESFGMTVLEAISCGTPSLATNKCGVCEILENKTDAVVPAGDIASLAKTLECILQTKSNMETLEKEREIIQKYTWESVANQILNVYNSLL